MELVLMTESGKPIDPHVEKLVGQKIITLEYDKTGKPWLYSIEVDDKNGKSEIEQSLGLPVNVMLTDMFRGSHGLGGVLFVVDR